MTAAALAVAGVLSLAACSSSSDGGGSSKGTAPVTPLVQAAQKEGSLTVYESVDDVGFKKAAEQFTKTYGVKVNSLRLVSSALQQRFSAEAQSRVNNADFILVSRTGYTKIAVDSGWLTPLASADIPGFPGSLPTKFNLPDEDTAIVSIQPAGIAYNTDMVKGDDIPKTWSDVLKPKWTGKIGISDITSSPSYPGEWYAVDKASGGGIISGFGALKPKVYASGVPTGSAVAAGEVAFSIMNLESTLPPKGQGAPVKFVTPALTTGSEVVAGLATKAKHPNAAKLFGQWITGQVGSQTLSDALGAVSPYDTSKLPAQYVSPDVKDGVAEQAQMAKILQGK